MLGTIIIAMFGYGFAGICAAATLIWFRDATRAKGTRERHKCLGNAVFGVCFTMAFAAITRWLIGGAL